MLFPLRKKTFTRFRLRGIEKVETEFGIVALAHNLLKFVGNIKLFSGKCKKSELRNKRISQSACRQSP
ncbi:transposase [Pallidibacillus thermolactis]|uniref:transposase n=1 Tax=Pallidibacillus thermolactis TaxID=251051 RepID=UPI00389953C9